MYSAYGSEDLSKEELHDPRIPELPRFYIYLLSFNIHSHFPFYVHFELCNRLPRPGVIGPLRSESEPRQFRFVPQQPDCNLALHCSLFDRLPSPESSGRGWALRSRRSCHVQSTRPQEEPSRVVQAENVYHYQPSGKVALSNITLDAYSALASFQSPS